MADDSTLDPSTGLLHRAAFLKEVRNAQLQSNTTIRRGCLLIFNFPGLLDVAQQDGKEASSNTLKNILAIIDSRLRKRDTLGRIGDQSLCLLLRHCEENDAALIADQYETLLNDVAFDGRLLRALAGFHHKVVSLDTTKRRTRVTEDEAAGSQALSEASVLLSTIRSFGEIETTEPGELVSFTETHSEQKESQDSVEQNEKPSAVRLGAAELSDLSEQNWRLKPGCLPSQQMLVTCYRVQPVGFASRGDSLEESAMLNDALNGLALNRELSRPAIESMLILSVEAAQLTNQASLWLKERCKQQKIAPSDICFLLSVDAVSHDLRNCMPVLRRLNRQGVRLMLEGVSSAPQFSALQNLAGFDYLWISAKNLQLSHKDVRKRQEVESLIQAAHSQHREVCAAGIDTPSLLAHASSLNIDIVFGRECGRSLPFPKTES